jgi:hypothetical protein
MPEGKRQALLDKQVPTKAPRETGVSRGVRVGCCTAASVYCRVGELEPTITPFRIVMYPMIRPFSTTA